MEQDRRWITQSATSDPGESHAAVAALPCGVGALAAAVQGLLVHMSWADLYGLEAPLGPAADRTTLPVADRLRQVLSKDPRPLDEPRRPEDRRRVTCRDFALMLCGFLRAKGVASRLRCGFADYLGPTWTDHWLCEYRDDTGTWRLADAQLDGVLGRRLGIAFDPVDVPRSAFWTAGLAWMACRSGRAEPARFGADGTMGAWMVGIDVVRDALAVQGRDVSPWDGWRAAPDATRVMAEARAARLDEIAAHPERTTLDLLPDWVTSAT